jgi:N-methylhydantoinase A
VLLSGRSLSAPRVARERERIVAEARAALGEPAARVRVRHELRYRGQSFELPVEEELEPPEPGRNRPQHGNGGSWGLDPRGLRDAFARAHEQRYGYRDERAQIELVNMRASVWGHAPALHPRAGGPIGAGTRAGSGTGPGAAPTPEQRPVVFDGAALQSTILRGELAPGSAIAGPAVCALPEATLLVPPGWAGEVDEHGTVRLAQART